MMCVPDVNMCYCGVPFTEYVLWRQECSIIHNSINFGKVVVNEPAV